VSQLTTASPKATAAGDADELRADPAQGGGDSAAKTPAGAGDPRRRAGYLVSDITILLGSAGSAPLFLAAYE
jgi:hypothetical protein